MRKVDRAYEQLRDDLIALRIEPGEPLDEKRLSASLGVGLTPVRDAIKRLTLERLVVTYPRRGTFAAEISVSDELWLTEIREDLEGLAAALAAVRATAAEREELSRLADLVDSHPSAGHGSTSYIEVDAAIHRAIYAAAHNPFLETSLNQYANLAMRIWHYGLRRVAQQPAAGCDQAEVVEAIVRGDADAARESARAHLRDFSNSVRALLTR
ncbi:GntR family transcriptional regulator [Saccharopolyspora subtropica]|uniref:GntR family transcriptional regulator n=1 Tax=Saccharopolyspora thermophila TaxID=89367 RepID=A0A917NE55_9PSEU|nr:GntR family transcriptional regulator [Saccharopolyspora subtropica]GGI91931.1 GntR family transcriptional regulator [Saccharopolyspora subtropica]